jgi:hypothetical protein
MTNSSENTQQPSQPNIEVTPNVDPSSIQEVAAQVRSTMDLTFQELEQERRENEEKKQTVLVDIYKSAMDRVTAARSQGLALEVDPAQLDGGFRTDVFLSDGDKGAYRIFISKIEQNKEQPSPWGDFQIQHFSTDPSTGEVGNDDFSLGLSYGFSEHEDGFGHGPGKPDFRFTGAPESVTPENGPQLAELIKTLPILDKNGPELKTYRAKGNVSGWVSA